MKICQLLWFWYGLLQCQWATHLFIGCSFGQPLRSWRCSRSSSWTFWFTFHCLPAIMSLVVLWFQYCFPHCSSSFSTAVTCHCNLQYLTVLQNGYAELGVLPRQLLIQCYLTTDSWFNHSVGASRPSFTCIDCFVKGAHSTLYLEFYFNRSSRTTLASKSCLNKARHWASFILIFWV